jgi:hypothetical protein
MEYQGGVRAGPGPLRIHAVIPLSGSAASEGVSLCRRFPLLLTGEPFDPKAVYSCPDCRLHVAG